VIDEAFPSGRSFEEVVDLALEGLDGVGAATPAAAEPGAEVPRRLKAAAVRRLRPLAVVQRPRRSRQADSELAVSHGVHHALAAPTAPNVDEAYT